MLTTFFAWLKPHIAESDDLTHKVV